MGMLAFILYLTSRGMGSGPGAGNKLAGFQDTAPGIRGGRASHCKQDYGASDSARRRSSRGSGRRPAPRNDGAGNSYQQFNNGDTSKNQAAEMRTPIPRQTGILRNDDQYGRGGSGSETVPVIKVEPAHARPASRSSLGSAKYFFTIGSVEALERKLEIAQRELGIDTHEFIPVQYVNQTSWGAEAMKFAPTLLILGFWLYMMRGMGGGGMGGRRSHGRYFQNREIEREEVPGRG